MVDKEEREIEHFDFYGMAGMPCEDKLVEWTETPFEPFDSPRNRVVMIKMPDGFQESICSWII